MSHMTMGDEIHALRTTLARVEAERDALAAHVGQLEALVWQARAEYIEQNADGETDCVTPYDIYGGPDTSLAELKARTARRHFLYGYQFCRANGFLFDDQLQAAGHEYAARVRRQAAEGPAE